MSDTTRQHTPDERLPPNTSNLLESTLVYAQNETSNLAHEIANITTNIEAPSTCPTSTQPETQPNPQTLLNQLLNALNSSDENIHNLINHLPSTWRATNHKGTPSTKQCSNEAHGASLESLTTFKHCNRQFSRHTHRPTTRSRNILHTSLHQ